MYRKWFFSVRRAPRSLTCPSRESFVPVSRRQFLPARTVELLKGSYQNEQSKFLEFRRKTNVSRTGRTGSQMGLVRGAWNISHSPRSSSYCILHRDHAFLGNRVGLGVNDCRRRADCSFFSNGTVGTFSVLSCRRNPFVDGRSDARSRSAGGSGDSDFSNRAVPPGQRRIPRNCLRCRGPAQLGLVCREWNPGVHFGDYPDRSLAGNQSGISWLLYRNRSHRSWICLVHVRDHAPEPENDACQGKRTACSLMVLGAGVWPNSEAGLEGNFAKFFRCGHSSLFLSVCSRLRFQPSLTSIMWKPTSPPSILSAHSSWRRP